MSDAPFCYAWHNSRPRPPANNPPDPVHRVRDHTGRMRVRPRGMSVTYASSSEQETQQTGSLDLFRLLDLLSAAALDLEGAVHVSTRVRGYRGRAPSSTVVIGAVYPPLPRPSWSDLGSRMLAAEPSERARSPDATLNALTGSISVWPRGAKTWHPRSSLMGIAAAVLTLALGLCTVGACREAPRATAWADDAYRWLTVHGDDVARTLNKREMVQAVRLPGQLKTVDDVAKAGLDMPVEQLMRAARKRAAYEIDLDITYREVLDAGVAVQDAHCDGLKKELVTGSPTTFPEYITLLIYHYASAQIPQPPAQELREQARHLVAAASALKMLMIAKPIDYRASIVRACQML